MFHRCTREKVNRTAAVIFGNKNGTVCMNSMVERDVHARMVWLAVYANILYRRDSVGAQEKG
jgi:hypothetical protein